MECTVATLIYYRASGEISVQSLVGVQGSQGRARTTFIRIVSEAKPEQSAGRG